MAETARQIIYDAMSAIEVFPNESSIRASETELIKRRLNRMMSRWEAKGIKLGFTEIDNISEYLTVPDAVIDGIIYNLAVQIAPDFLGGDAAKNEVKVLANDAMADVRAIAITTQPSGFPSTLPRGRANNRYGSRYNRSTFTDMAASIFATNSGTTITISVAGTPVKIAGTWANDKTNLFEFSNTGKFTYIGKGPARLRVKAQLYVEVASGTDDLTFYIAKNGVVIEDSEVQIESTAGSSKEVLLSKNVDFLLNDYVELYAANEDETANITLNMGTIYA